MSRVCPDFNKNSALKNRKTFHNSSLRKGKEEATPSSSSRQLIHPLERKIHDGVKLTRTSLNFQTQKLIECRSQARRKFNYTVKVPFERASTESEWQSQEQHHSFRFVFRAVAKVNYSSCSLSKSLDSSNTTPRNVFPCCCRCCCFLSSLVFRSFPHRRRRRLGSFLK